MMKHQMTTDWLKKNSIRAYYFGLGFIQIKLNNVERVHFYAKELPAFVDTPHNHRYDFVSNILSGTFRNIIWNEDDLNGYWFNLTQETCKPPGTEEVAVRTLEARAIRLSQIFDQFYHAGSSYFIDHNTFHTVEPEPDCITYLCRSAYRKDLADVATPMYQNAACPFSKPISDNDLWEIVDRMIKDSSHTLKETLL